MRATALAAGFGALLALGGGGASAQYGGDRPGDFDFYVLSLSWSPTYCASRGRRSQGMQCGGDKSYAFVVHGLWPQYERGFPSQCRTTGRTPTRAQVDDILDLMPSPGLVRHEWREHGACTGLDPARYLREIRNAADTVRIPPTMRNAERDVDVSPADVERAFIAENPTLRPTMISVQCADGLLNEVRICMTRDLAFRPCAEIDRRACRAGRVTMPAVSAR